MKTLKEIEQELVLLDKEAQAFQPLYILSKNGESKDSFIAYTSLQHVLSKQNEYKALGYSIYAYTLDHKVQ